MTLKAFFEGIARGDHLEKQDVSRYLEQLGLGKGLFGKVKVKAALQVFMARFDKDPKDGGVSWDELRKHAKDIIPKNLLSGGMVDLERTRREFTRWSKGQDSIGFDESKSYLETQLPLGLRGNFADALARLALDILDHDHDGRFRWPDLEAIVREYNAELRAAA